jgi:membrane protease YdiL (CAAX protease family)
VSAVGAPAGCRPWGPAASLAWALAAAVLWLGFQVVVGDILLGWFFDGNIPADTDRIVAHAPFVTTITLSASVVPLVVIAVAVRMARCDFADYLGLHLPERNYVLIGIGALAILIPLVDLVSWLAGYAVTPSFVVNIYRSSRNSGVLVFLILALVVAAPVVEETMFRGFLLPSLAQSRLGPAGAILFTSIAWALLHAQYQPFYLIQIVVLGSLFGWLRLRSGSLTLTIFLHGIVNAVSLVQAAVFAELYR